MRVRLPIHESMQPDEVGLISEGAGSDMRNFFVDELNSIHRWYGYEEFADTAEGAKSVDSLYWWANRNAAIAVCNQKIFKIVNSSGTISQIAAGGGGTFYATSKGTFAEHGTDLYFTNGQNINKITLTNVDVIADADAPTSVSHVAFLDRYLLGNEANTGNFHWSDVNAPTSWSAYYTEAESSPDYTRAIFAIPPNLYAFGSNTVEQFYNDGATFVRLYQGIVQSGTMADDSVVWCPAVQGFVYIDNFCNLVQLSGGVPKILNPSLSKYIQSQGAAVVATSVGHYIQIADRAFYILFLATTAGESVAYDFKSGKWFRLGEWSGAAYTTYGGISYCYCPLWNLSLMGGKATGKIYKLAPTIYTNATATLRGSIITPHYNHGDSSKRKFCDGVYIRCKRTQANTATAAPSVYIRYRDGHSDDTDWTTARTLTLHDINETDFIAYTTRLGSYYSRQWNIYYSDAYPVSIVSMDEDVEIEQ